MPLLDLLLSTMTPEFWTRCCERLLAELPEQQFNTWIRPLSPPALSALSPEAGAGSAQAQWAARLEMPNRFKLDWVRSQYGALLQSIMNEVAQTTVRLDLALAPQRAPAHGTALALPGSPGLNGASRASGAG